MGKDKHRKRNLSQISPAKQRESTNKKTNTETTTDFESCWESSSSELLSDADANKQSADNQNKPYPTRIMKMAEINDFSCLLRATMQEPETINMFRLIFKSLMAEQHKELQGKIASLEKHSEIQKKSMESLQKRVETLEQERLSNNVRISGLGIKQKPEDTQAALSNSCKSEAMSMFKTKLKLELD